MQVTCASTTIDKCPFHSLSGKGTLKYWPLAAPLLLIDRVRFLASYSLCVPLFGASGGWIGLFDVGLRLSQGYMLGTSHYWLAAHAFVLALVIGYCLGMAVGAFAGLGINRLARLVAT